MSVSVYLRLLSESPDLIFLTIFSLYFPKTRLIGVLFIIFLLYFHRTPNIRRAIGRSDEIPNYFTSPCYGTVTKVDADANKVQVFLGLNDIHIQYAPCDGIIESRTKDCCGYFPANTDYSDNNTAVTTVLKTDFGMVKVKQISGVLARKIIVFGQPGDALKRGEELGFIRFGSRVDITFPPGTQILVRPGESLSGPGSVIAHYEKKVTGYCKDESAPFVSS